jgi:hypothetical protein
MFYKDYEQMERRKLMCSFEKDGLCYALCCYGSTECGAKNKDGSINYAETEVCLPDKK